MNKTYLYFTKARIALILTTIGSLVWLGFQLNTTGSWWEVLINLVIGAYIAVVLGCLEADLIKSPPENFEPPETLIEYRGDVLDIEKVFGKIGYDEEGNALGECTGVYFTKEAEYLMVGNHLYDTMGVYFDCDDEEEEE